MSLADNVLNQHFMDTLSNIQNEDHDILDEFLDQRVYDSISNNNMLRSDSFLTSSNAASIVKNETGNDDRSPLSKNSPLDDATAGFLKLEDNDDHDAIMNDFMNDDLSLSLNDNEFLDLKMMDDSTGNDFLNDNLLNSDTSSLLQNHNLKSQLQAESAMKIKNEPHSTNVKISDSIDEEFQSYEIARNELSKLKFGNPVVKNPKPMDLPQRYLDFSNQSDLPYKLTINGLPSYSRVETQIKVRLALSPPPAQFLVHLASDLVSKPKFCLNGDLPESVKPNLLYLDTFVLTSDNKSCNICSRCIKREQKRASRRKSGLNDENSNWDDEVNKKAIIFNCKEIISFPPPNGLETEKILELSARIICYCRHHQELKGFKLLFVVTDHLGKIVARTVSSPIMIMDRKKTTASENNSSSGINGIATGGLSSLQPLSPTSIDESSSEPHTTDSRSLKRKRLGNDDMLASMTTTPLPSGVKSLSISSNNAGGASSTHHLSPMSDNSHIFRSPSNVSTNLSFVDQPNTAHLPSIQRIIPSQGPIRGGIEVTLLGCNFRPGLIVKFGSNQALATHCWSDSTIVTYLPPASQAGQVLVSFENFDSNNQSSPSLHQQQVFTYLDDTDRQLIELALQIVGLKMNGKLEDARNIARRIVGTDKDGSSSKQGTSSENGSPNTQNRANQEWLDNAHKTVDQLTKSDMTTEDVLLNFLSLLDLPNCPTTPNFQICTSQGQTLLHLATLKNFTNLAKFLITHGCKIESKDNQGLTPLFYAGLAGNRELMKLFIDCKANWNLKLSNGRYLRHYCDLNVLDMFNDLENQRSDEENNYDIGISKQLSSDSLNSLFTLNYGRHISKMVIQNNSSDSFNTSPAASELIYNDMLDGGSGSGYDDDSEADADFEDENSSIIDIETESTATITNTEVLLAEVDERDDSNSSGIEISTEPSGLWQRVRSVFNNDSHDEDHELPNYDDLFPFGAESASKQKIQELSSVATIPAADEGCSSNVLEVNENSDEIVAKFINQRKQVRNDKMLLFFWLPVLLMLIGLFVFGDRFGFGDRFQELLRSRLVTFMIGSERVKGVFANVNSAVSTAVTAVTPYA